MINANKVVSSLVPARPLFHSEADFQHAFAAAPTELKGIVEQRNPAAHSEGVNKDRSIFRKNIGRALLKRRHDPFLEQWNLDLTSRRNRERYQDLVDFDKQAAVEREVTERIQDSFHFVVFEVPDKERRLELERKMIGTVSLCRDCTPSVDWLGLASPKRKIPESGLWQEQELWKPGFGPQEIESIQW